MRLLAILRILPPWVLPVSTGHAQSASTQAATASAGGAVQHPYFSAARLNRRIRLCDASESSNAAIVEAFLLEANQDKFPGKKVLNIGAGAGLLALYAAQLGAAKVVATDADPRAVACTRANARMLGLDSLVETRLAAPGAASAFSPVATEDRFDVILSAQPEQDRINRVPRVVDGSIDDGIGPDDTLRLGFSIIDGLRDHLRRDGTAVLLYGSMAAHDLMVRYARYRRYDVEHHPGLWIQDSDWCALYNSFALEVSRSEGIDPSVLLIPSTEDPLCGRRGDRFSDVRRGSPEAAAPPLWGKYPNRVLPGIIVIRNPGARPDSVRRLPGGPDAGPP